MLLAELGVSYVISGDFAGWNFGIAEAGWSGFAIAVGLMAVMYFVLVLSLAEMFAAIPAAGGGYSFARHTMGSAGGCLTGLAILIEYVLGPAAIVVFIGAAIACSQKSTVINKTYFSCVDKGGEAVKEWVFNNRGSCAGLKYTLA